MENRKQMAFPITIEDNGNASVTHLGLTKREYFAAMAMQGWIACQYDGFTGDENAVALKAVKYADAVLAELDKPKSE